MNPELKLTLFWIGLMLVYLLGDVLRVYDLGSKAAEIDGQRMSPKMFLLAAGFMILPILMIFLNVLLPISALKWLNVIMSSLIGVINLIGINSYAGLYDRLLIAVSVGINGLIIWASVSWL